MNRVAPLLSPIRHDLAGALLHALRSARELGRDIVVSYVTSLGAAAAPDDGPRLDSAESFFWTVPGRDLVLSGEGAAWSATGTGEARFAQVKEAWQQVEKHVYIDGELVRESDLPHGSGPVLFGGGSFIPGAGKAASPLWESFPDAYFFLPERLVTHLPSGRLLTRNIRVRPTDDPGALAAGLPYGKPSSGAAAGPRCGGPASGEMRPPASHVAPSVDQADAWSLSVAHVKEALRRGRARKVVLARSLTVESGDRPFEPDRVLALLEADHPDCYVFGVRRGECVFAGATPERLLRLDGKQVLASALAGSTARGASPADDERLARELAESAKERYEHQLVVDWLRSRLAPHCVSLEAAPRPGVARFTFVQHLHTPLEGVLAQPSHILDLIAAVHPTPAVGGDPPGEALALIADHERVDRGWYAGPVGWFNPSGEGEMAVAIRSALLRGHSATLFAGCGIVSESDPRREFEESRLKFRAMLESLERSRR